MFCLRETLRLASVCLFITLSATTIRAQQRILWQGTVKPERMNVYTSASTKDRVTTTLKQGDVVDVVLEIDAIGGNAWCRIAFQGQSEPSGYVLCLNLDQSHATPKRVARNEPVATQSRALASETSATQNLTEATIVNAALLTNKDILDMNKTGLPPEILVAKIKSSPCDFNTSPQQLQQLKLNGLPDTVILAMVQARPEQSESSVALTPAAAAHEAKAPITGTGVALENSHQSSSSPCVILKRMGPADQITSHMYSFGLRGKQFQYVEGELPHGASFHGRLTDHDIRIIQDKGGKVLILEPKYGVADLQEARKGCQQ